MNIYIFAKLRNEDHFNMRLRLMSHPSCFCYSSFSRWNSLIR